jgi:glycine cleavage system H protein
VEIPEDLRYTSDHEWVRVEDGHVRIGITDFAQEALGDIVFVELPTIGEEIATGAVLGEVESTKSVSEVYAPLKGRVIEVNSELAGSPEHINSDPYGAGWICVMEPGEAVEDTGLLDPDAYRNLIAT